jgi:hypothetical protein
MLQAIRGGSEPWPPAKEMGPVLIANGKPALVWLQIDQTNGLRLADIDGVFPAPNVRANCPLQRRMTVNVRLLLTVHLQNRARRVPERLSVKT